MRDVSQVAQTASLDGILVPATSWRAQKLFANLGFDILREFPFKSGGKEDSESPDIIPLDGTEKCQLMFKKLKEVTKF